jgi:hypothetical protein
MTLREELNQLYREEEEIKGKIRDVYRRSMSAPENEIWFSSNVYDDGPMKMRKTLMSIRPVADEYNGKTFLGVYVGDIAISQTAMYNKESGVLSVSLGMYNPAIFVPDLGKIIFGYESWWSPIKSVDQVRKITNEDIENTWYVKFLREMDKKNGG